MNIETVLMDLGFSEGEISVYTTLLKFGPIKVSEIKEKSNLHRTTIYDFLEKLINKGIVNYHIKNNIKFYNATQPEKILDFLKEKEHSVNQIIPQLKELVNSQKEDFSVEVYKGPEGIKTILNEFIRNEKDLLIFGVDESYFKEILGSYMEHYFRKQKQIGFKERILTMKGVKELYSSKLIFYRFLPKESFNPTPTYVSEDYIAILVWEPLHIVKIKNKNLADSYKKHFELLWRIAEK